MNLTQLLNDWNQISPFQDLEDIERQMKKIALQLGKDSSDFLLKMLTNLERDQEEEEILAIFHDFLYFYYQEYKLEFRYCINSQIHKYLNSITFLDLLNLIPEGHQLLDLVDQNLFSKKSNEWKIAFTGAIGRLRNQTTIPFLNDCLDSEENKEVAKELQIAIQHLSK